MGEILDNFLKVYQLANFIKHSQIQQQLERERMAAEQEQHAYQRQLQDFNIRNAMQQVGAQEVQPIGEIASGFGADWLQQGKKQQITTPAGETYQLPTYQERQNRLLESIRAKGQVESDTAIGRAAAVEEARQRVRSLYQQAPNLHFITRPIGEDLVTVGLDPKTGEEKTRQVEKGGAKSAGANVRIDHYMDAETGTRVTEIRDPKTGELIKRETQTGAVTPRAQRTATTGGGGLSTGARLLMQDAQKAIDKARETNDENDKQTALNKAQQAAESFPNELEGGAGDGGWAYIKPKAKATVSAPAVKGGPDPRIGKEFIGRDGKRYRVQSIDPKDGQPILIPIP